MRRERHLPQAAVERQVRIQLCSYEQVDRQILAVTALLHGRQRSVERSSINIEAVEVETGR